MNAERTTPYDQHLAYRDDFMNVGPRFFVRTGLMRRMLRGVSGRIIDVGCGDGFFLEQLLAMGFDCAGLDVSEPMIERCRQRISSERLELVCDVIQNYQPDRPFDAAVCGETLEHIEDDVAVLTHIHRVLKPRGILVLTVPIDMTLWSEADVSAGHVRRYSKAEIFEKLQKTGFVVQDYAVWGYPLTRALHFKIREQQTDLMRGSVKTGRRRWLRCFMRPGRYLFLIDNLFNSTEKGVGIVVRAVKV
jgi:ubiquinone/menaquinone biosynthesis C-methylase UbiE